MSSGSEGGTRWSRLAVEASILVWLGPPQHPPEGTGHDRYFQQLTARGFPPLRAVLFTDRRGVSYPVAALILVPGRDAAKFVVAHVRPSKN
jgi:hypothetical protein